MARCDLYLDMATPGRYGGVLPDIAKYNQAWQDISRYGDCCEIAVRLLWEFCWIAVISLWDFYGITVGLLWG